MNPESPKYNPNANTHTPHNNEILLLSKKIIEDILKFQDSIIQNSVIDSVRNDACLDLLYILGENDILDKIVQKKDITIDDLWSRILVKNKNVVIKASIAEAYGSHQIVLNHGMLLISYLLQTHRIKGEIRDSIKTIAQQYGGNMLYAIESDPNQTKFEAIKTFNSRLQENESLFRENIETITTDKKYQYSLHNVLCHEFSHILFAHFNNVSIDGDFGSHIIQGLNEGFSFGIQNSTHLFQKNRNISTETIRHHIIRTYRLIHKTKNSYNREQHDFMKSFIPLLSGLFASTAIGLQNLDTSNQKLLNQAYHIQNISEIFDIYDKALDNIENPIHKNLLIKLKEMSLKKLKETSTIIQQDCYNEIEKLHNIPDYRYDNFEGYNDILYKTMNKAERKITMVIESLKEKKSLLEKIEPIEKIEVLRETIKKTLEKVYITFNEKEDNNIDENFITYQRILNSFEISF